MTPKFTRGLTRTLTPYLCAFFAFLLPPPASAPPTGIEPYIKMRWPFNGDLASDGTLYFVYDPDGIRQLHKVPPGGTQKDAVKLTTFADGIGGDSVSDD